MPSNKTESAPLNAGDVVAYLRQHPDFLNKHPDLYEVLEVASREHGDAVVDFQQHAMRNLQDNVKDLQEDNITLLEMTRAQISSMIQVQRAVISLIDATHLEGFMERLCNDVPNIFQCDVLRLGLEGDPASYESYSPQQHYSGLVLVPEPFLDSLFEDGDAIWDSADTLFELPEHVDILFKECVDLARSAMFVHIELPRIDKRAVIAFGSRHRGYFAEDYDTDMMHFFGRIVGLRLDQYICEQVGLL